MPIFHLDIESFMTTVERVKHPEFRGRPLVIAPDKARATVLAASPEAKLLGIVRDMPTHHVRRFFPGVTLIAPDHQLYNRASRYILNIAGGFSPIIEPVNYGHIAMDMTGMHRMFGSLENAALKLCREVRERARLPATIGIASNKLVSTIAAKEVQKNREELCQVDHGNEAVFLGPLSCKALPEWEDRAVRKLLFELNLRKISQIQTIPRDLISFATGEIGTRLHQHANGIDTRPVTPPRETRQLSEKYHFHPDTNDDDEIRAMIYAVLEKLCVQLRAKGLAAAKARVSLRYTDDVWSRRQFSFVRTHQEQPIYQRILKDYERLCQRRRRIRFMEISLGGLFAPQQQPGLFTQPKIGRVASHLDKIRSRFGDGAIRFGRTFGIDTEAETSRSQSA